MPADRHGHIYDGAEPMCVLFGMSASGGTLVQTIDGLWSPGAGPLGGDPGQRPPHHIRGSSEDTPVVRDPAVSAS